MAAAAAPPAMGDPALARLHSLLRFSVGTTAPFVLCEAMAWYPTFLAPLLAGVLLANLPRALPLKAGLLLILVQAAGAYSAYILTSFLHETPIVLFGTIGLLVFLCFANLARGRAFLPILLVLIAFATIPIVTMLIPQEASPMPFAFLRAMAVAVVSVWLVHALWPQVSEITAAPPVAAFATPIKLAITGVAIVMPLMLLYLMYSITDALPILITTIVLIINFDPRRGAAQGFAMMIGNFIGGMIALFAGALVRTSPSLMTFGLVAFLIGSLFAGPVDRRGPRGAVALVTFNQTVVMFSLALVPGGSAFGVWAMRLMQFGIACTFAIGMMTLLFRRPVDRTPA